VRKQASIQFLTGQQCRTVEIFRLVSTVVNGHNEMANVIVIIVIIVHEKYLKEIKCDRVGWINLIQDKVQLWTFVKTVPRYRAPYK
jgi:hypothetical protein